MLRVFTGDLKEVVFQGAIDPHTPVGQGWLRASHRKLDKKLSTPYRPYHTHDQKQPLKKGEVVELDIEIWPTSIVVPAGYRVGAHHPRQGLRLSAARAAASSRTSRTSSPAAARSCTTTRATVRLKIFGGITSLHFGGGRRPICCCRSSRRRNDSSASNAPGQPYRTVMIKTAAAAMRRVLSVAMRPKL